MVKFIGAINHGLKHGYYSKEKGFSTNKGWWDDCLIVLKGRKEYVVECNDYLLIETLKSLPNDSFLFQKMKVITQYLNENEIPWEIEGQPSIL